MAFNPMKLMQLKSHWGKFSQGHPKFQGFLGAAGNKIEEGSIIDIKITNPDGHTIETNLKMSKDDVAFIQAIKGLRG